MEGSLGQLEDVKNRMNQAEKELEESRKERKDINWKLQELNSNIGDDFMVRAILFRKRCTASKKGPRIYFPSMTQS
jgi:chromosome segregation ATPase